MQKAAPIRVRLGAFEFDLKAGELRKGARRKHLQGQPFQVLLMLVEASGELVTREELKKKLWPNDTAVEFDDSIHAAIKRLRQALGDSADKPKYVETIARRGYRLIVPVESLESAPGNGLDVAEAAGSDNGMAARIQLQADVLPGKKVSHYRVLEVIGGGGMGLVYKAEDLKLGRRVALKFLPEELASDPVALQRFEREARTASSLNHPNICTIYEIEEHDGQPFIVMELLEGETLRDRLAEAARDDKSIPLDDLLRIAMQVADGLEAAHERDIIHRDIKPANIFLTQKGAAKILDFGLAKLATPGTEIRTENAIEERSPQPLARNVQMDGAPQVEHTLTRTGTAMGTAGYMSPEQVRGERLDSRTDLFSFGLVLYEMATGQRAFGGATAAVIRNATLHAEPQSARQLNPKVSPKLDNIIAKCLEKDREQRYQRAAEIIADLRTLVKPLATWSRVLLISAVMLLALVVAAVLWIGRKEPTVLREPNLTQLTANSSDNSIDSMSISPDGEYLAYKDLKGFHLKLLKTGEIRDVPPPERVPRWAWDPGPWFPDSSALLVNSRSEIGDRPSIWKVSISGGAPHKIVDDAQAWAVSPDGSSIATMMHQGRIGMREIWLMDSNGEHAQKWLETDEDGNLGRMMWFPNGKRILYGRENQDAEHYLGFIESRAVSGGRSNTILSSGSSWGDGELRDHHLLPDARLVYLVGKVGVNGPACNYWVMQLDPQTGEPAGKPRQLTNWAGVCMDFTGGTADGKKLVFTKWSSEGSLYVSNVSKGGKTVDSASRLTLNDAVELPVGWTTDAKSVFYLSNVNGRLQIFSKALDKDNAKSVVTLASTPGGLLEDKVIPAVTPDGTSLLYPVFPGTGRTSPATKLMRTPLAGGAPEVLLSAPLYDAAHCTRLPANFCAFAELSPDGKQLVFISFDPLRGRGRELARFDAEANAYNGSGDEYPGNAFAWDLSADGARIAVFKKRENQIHVLSTTGPSMREITVRGWGVEELHWAPDGKGFFAASRGEDSSVLLHVDLQGNAHTVWQQKGREGLRCAPSPDGRHMAILALRLNNNVWMMENF